MAKILFVTSNEDKSTLLRGLKFSGVKSGSLIFYKFNKEEQNKFIKKIRENRPRLIFINGQIGAYEEQFSNIFTDIMNTIHKFDMDCDVYTYGAGEKLKFNTLRFSEQNNNFE